MICCRRVRAYRNSIISDVHTCWMIRMNIRTFNGCRIQAVRHLHSTGSAKTDRTRAAIDSIIRVDHAGELGADRIYAGQMAVLGNSKMGPIIQHMWDQEKVHKETFEKLIVKYRVRPTFMVPVWNIAGFLLGAGTALIGDKAAMACTVAVESVIVDHYNDQLRTLMSEPEINKELLETIQKFRDDEQEHHDSGLNHGAEQAPFYKGLTEVIKLGCKAAIAISKEVALAKKGPNFISSRSYCTYNVPRRAWDLCGAVCLERKPVITKEWNSLERKYMEYLNSVEYENSYKSDHECKREEEEKNVELLKSQEKLTTVELELLSKGGTKGFEISSVEEHRAFIPGPRITDADKKNDVKSLRRKLDSHLMLVISKDFGNERKWIFPHVLRQDNETMRETAYRALTETCGNSLKVHFTGNAPCGFYKYKYPKAIKSSKYGAKIFFFKAFYLSGEVQLQNQNLDYRWISQSELNEIFTEGAYRKKIQQFLISDIDYYDEIKNFQSLGS